MSGPKCRVSVSTESQGCAHQPVNHCIRNASSVCDTPCLPYSQGSSPLCNALFHLELFSFLAQSHMPARMDVAQAGSWWCLGAVKASRHVKRHTQNQFLEVGKNSGFWFSTKKEQAGEKPLCRQIWVYLHLVRCTKQLVEKAQRTPTDCRQCYFYVCRTKIKAVNNKLQKTWGITLQRFHFFHQTIPQTINKC